MTRNFMWFPATEAEILATTPGIPSRLGFDLGTGRWYIDDGSVWHRVNPVSKGAWSSSAAYQSLDLVTYGGSTWLALTGSTNVTPAEGGYWTLFAAKGDTGAQGPQGIQGVQGTTGAQGPTGPPGTPPDASTTVKGIGKVSVAPADAANPVFVGDNDARNSNTRTPTDGTVTDAKVASGAAIAESKLNLASDAAAGTASRRTLGTGALQAASGTDGRFTDTRTPTDGTVTDAKVAVGAAIAESKLSLASDAAAGTASRRTLGTGALQAAAGNDARFTAVARVYKSADETVTNSAALQNDDQLLFAIPASEAWAFKFVIFYNGGTTTDFKIGITVPTGATRLIWSSIGPPTGQTVLATINEMGPVTTSGGNVSFGGMGVGVPVMVTIDGTILNGTTAGNVQLQWAQDVAAATNTVVQAGSYLDARKLT